MSNEEFAILLVQEGESPRTNWELDKSVMLVGRGQDCEVVIDDRQVSRHHARITCEAGFYYLQDLHSKNGTFVNGVQLQPDTVYRLKDGDQIGIALGSRIIFVEAGATAPLLQDKVLSPEVKIDTIAKRVWVAGQELSPPLSLAQYKLLELLFTYQGGVVSRDELVATVWSDEEAEGVSEQAIDALARRLRERLAEIDPDTQYVITIRGHGFRLENFAE